MVLTYLPFDAPRRGAHDQLHDDEKINKRSTEERMGRLATAGALNAELRGGMGEGDADCCAHGGGFYTC